MRLAICTNFVSPYRIPLFDELAKTPGWELKVFCSSETEFDRQWEPSHKFSFRVKKSFNVSYKRRIKHNSSIPFEDKRQVHLPVGLLLDLWRYNPEVVISMEMGARSLIAALYSLIARKRFVLWFYGSLHSERDISWKQRILRNILVKIPNSFIGMGTECRKYLKSLNIKDEEIFDAKNAIEMSGFSNQNQSGRRELVRRELDISGLCYLYVGRMMEGKGLKKLLDAWGKFSMEVDYQSSLVLVGDGEQKEFLEARAATTNLKNVKFVPFIQPSKLPEIYQASDIFVFPTLQDVWGLVVNEAMASSLPVICSKYAGCTPDLIVENQNGWTVDPTNEEDLIRKLYIAWDMRHRKELMGKVSRKIINNVDIPGMANGIRNAVAYSLPA